MAFSPGSFATAVPSEPGCCEPSATAAAGATGAGSTEEASAAEAAAIEGSDAAHTAALVATLTQEQATLIEKLRSAQAAADAAAHEFRDQVCRLDTHFEARLAAVSGRLAEQRERANLLEERLAQLEQSDRDRPFSPAAATAAACAERTHEKQRESPPKFEKRQGQFEQHDRDRCPPQVAAVASTLAEKIQMAAAVWANADNRQSGPTGIWEEAIEAAKRAAKRAAIAFREKDASAEAKASETDGGGPGACDGSAAARRQGRRGDRGRGGRRYRGRGAAAAAAAAAPAAKRKSSSATVSLPEHEAQQASLVAGSSAKGRFARSVSAEAGAAAGSSAPRGQSDAAATAASPLAMSSRKQAGDSIRVGLAKRQKRGVCWDKQAQRWRARCRKGKSSIQSFPVAHYRLPGRSEQQAKAAAFQAAVACREASERAARPKL